MNDESALSPSLEPLIPEEVEEVQEEQQVALNGDDENLASLLYHPGFAPIRDKLEKYVEDFKSGSGMSFTKDTPLDVIGQKYVVSSTIGAICKDILDMVNNAATAVAERENASRGRKK